MNIPVCSSRGGGRGENMWDEEHNPCPRVFVSDLPKNLLDIHRLLYQIHESYICIRLRWLTSNPPSFFLPWESRRNYQQTWKALVLFLWWARDSSERLEELEFCSSEEILDGTMVEFYLLDSEEELESWEEGLWYFWLQRGACTSIKLDCMIFSPFLERRLPLLLKQMFQFI